MSKDARTLAVALIGVVTLVSAACSPTPEGETTPDWFAGGTFPVEVSIPSQTTSATFDLLWGLGTCTTTVTTPSVEIPDGTLTLDPVEIDPSAATVTIPEASLDLPGSTISAGAISLRCNDAHIATIGLSIAFDGAASVQTATIDTATNTVTLAETELSITNASLAFAWEGATPVPLAPFTTTVPSISLPLGSIV